MHIPDNYLSPATCAVMGAAMIPVWIQAAIEVKRNLPRERIPLLGIGAAFSFLIMMFNVPLPGGTTGHAVGGTLIAVLFGPGAATFAISVALLIQALLFGDGGILSFGANCFNMAFVIPYVGYAIYTVLKRALKGRSGETIGLAVGSYVGINVAALCAAIEFGIQPLLFRDAAGLPMYCPYPLAISIPAMLLPHLLVAGVAEAIFTVAVVGFVRRASPATIHALERAPGRAPASTGKGATLRPLLALMAVLIVLSPLGLLASGTAWGEWGRDEIAKVAQGGASLGFVPSGMQHGLDFSAFMKDYGVSGLPELAGYLLSAIAGAAILVIVFKLLGLRRHQAAGEERTS